MKALGDYLGLGLVIGSLCLGVLVALVANRLVPASAAAPSNAGATPAPATTAEVEPAVGNRELGRAAFQLNCQECHTQGRQSFDPVARGRTSLLRTRIREGASEMPAFPPERLSETTLQHVLAYIATPAEPEARPTPEPRVRGVNLDIVQASGRPGQPAAVRFRVTDDAGTTIAPSDMAVLALTVGGPTTDYRWARREDARRAQTLSDGSSEYVFTGLLPGDAGGTFAVGIEGAFDYPAGIAGPQAYREVGFNAVAYFAVTDPAPVPHRTVVRTESCNECHGTLATHGGTRRNTDICVICHNSTQTDEEKRTTASGPMPPEPVLFRNLVHRIHTGEDLQQPFVVFGGAPANPQPIDLTKIHPFPKDRANCALCHEPGTSSISRSLESLLPMVVAQGGQTVRQVPPVTSACTGCHDSARTLAHASAQTTSQGVETCAVCHGAGRPASVSAVHRISGAR